MSNRHVKVKAAALIRGRKYTTARGAARAWAEAVMEHNAERHRIKTGQPAYHDTKWYDWHYGQCPTRSLEIPGIQISMIVGPSYTVAKAMRRSLPIFKRYLK